MLPGARIRVVAIVLAHAIVDCVAVFIIPILSVLEGRLSMSHAQGALLIGVGSIASGLIQPVVALFADRLNTRWLGTLGMLVCVLAYCSVGYAQSFAALLALQVIGSAGSGAFHPVAAAATGQLSAHRRGLGLGVFFVAGMLGGIVGNAMTPGYVAKFSVESLIYIVPPGIMGACLLAWAVHATPHRASDATARHMARSVASRTQAWRGIAVLYLGNALRFSVNTMLVVLLIRWAEDAALREAGLTTLDAAVRQRAAAINGPLQAAMQVGMGLAGLALGTILAPRMEKFALIVGPIIGATIIVAFPHVPSSLAWGMAIGAGMAYAGLIPTTLSMAQRFLPHRTTMASALMLGGAWSVAALGPPIAQRLTASVGLEWSFAITGGMLAVSGLVSIVLPRDAEG